MRFIREELSVNEPDIIQKITTDIDATGSVSADVQSSPSLDASFADVQSLEATFNIVNDLSVSFNSPQTLNASFGSVYVVSGDCRVLYASTATWNSQPQLISRKGYIYIYSDYRQNEQGQNIAGFKVGDGSAYLIDMPFTEESLYEHIDNTVIHITQEEREFWNNKVRCFIDPLNEHNLIFTTD